jgi:hypothetical protein
MMDRFGFVLAVYGGIILVVGMGIGTVIGWLL